MKALAGSQNCLHWQKTQEDCGFCIVRYGVWIVECGLRVVWYGLRVMSSGYRAM
jgi:hypothetical protein